jgi:hypothetical protein
MSDHFAFRFIDPNAKAHSCLVIFTTIKPSLDLLSKVLKHDVETKIVPKKVYLLAPNNCSLTKADCQHDISCTNEYNAYIGDIEETLSCIEFGSDGKFRSAYYRGKQM